MAGLNHGAAIRRLTTNGRSIGTSSRVLRASPATPPRRRQVEPHRKSPERHLAEPCIATPWEGRRRDNGSPVTPSATGAPRLPQGAPPLVIRETSAMAGEGSCAPGLGRRVKANRLSLDSGAGGSTRSRRGGRHRGQRLDKASVTAISSLAGAGHLIENHLLQLPYVPK